MKSLFTFAARFGSGWVARSMTGSPHGLAVKLLEVTYRSQKRITRWVAEEREHFEDLLSEVRARVDSEEGASNTSSQSPTATSVTATPYNGNGVKGQNSA